MRKLFLLVLILLSSGQAFAQQLLKQSTATTVNIGPFIDDTDFKTLETGLTVTSMTVKVIKHSDTFSSSNTSFAPTASSGSNDCQHVASGMYNLELTAGNTDTLGRLELVITITGALPVFHRFMVIGTTAYDTQVTSTASIDDLMETDCSTIASTTSPMGKICSNVDGKITNYSVWKHATTIATLSSQISFTLTDGSADDNAYNGWEILVTDLTISTQMAIGVVQSYTGSTKAITLRSDPGVFTMSVGDSVQLKPDRSLKPSVDNRSLAVTAGGSTDSNVIQFGGTNGTFSAGRPEVNATHLAGTAQTGRDIGASVLLSSGTGTGQVKLAAGYVAPNWADIGSPTATVNLSGTTVGLLGGLTAGALADFFDTNSGTTYASAVAGSVVKETADNAGGSALTVGAIADGVWDEVLSGHLGAGSAGAALNAAGGAADPWATAVPGAYGAGTAGNIIGNNLNLKTSDAGSIVHFGTAQAGAATTITLAAGASGVANFYRDKRIVLTGGTGASQSAIITAYDQTTKVATIFCEGSSSGSWFTNPASGTTYVIVSRNRN